MDLKLGGKICLVTGASRGIGRGTAKVLAVEGCRVAIVARRESLLEELADEIEREAGARPLVVVEDLMSDGAAERVRAHVLGGLGGLDILVNNAGSSRPVKWDATEDQWREGLALNFDAVRRLTNTFIPTMRAQRWGRIINVTDANEPPGVNIASVGKAALHNWAKGLSRELAPDGITVNCVPPGRISSEQILERLHPTPENRAAFIAANIPIGYFGEPEDMAYLIAFLASPLARYITGEVIHVDGGMHRFGLAAPRSVELARLFALLDLTGLAQHFVDLVDVRLFLLDQVARVFLERDVLARDEAQELRVMAERHVLGLQRLAQDLADVVLVRLEQRTDRERRMPAEPRHELARPLRVRERLGRFRAEPRDDRNAAVAENHHRIVRVANYARELALENAVQLRDDLLLVDRGHGCDFGLVERLAVLAPAEAVRGPQQRTHSEPVILGVAARIARDDHVIARLQRVASDALSRE